ncbi:hypothetical protein SLE2022_381280 [Rubroshorea leprosula]
MAFRIRVLITLSVLFAFLTLCSARNTITSPSEDAANSNGNYGPPRTNSGLKPGHRPIYWRNDVVGTEDYGPTGPNPKHQPPPPPLVNTEDYGPTGPNPKHQPQPPPHHPLLSYVKTED